MLVTTPGAQTAPTAENDPALMPAVPRQRPCSRLFWLEQDPQAWGPSCLASHSYVWGQPLRPLCRSKFKSHYRGDKSTEQVGPGVDPGCPSRRCDVGQMFYFPSLSATLQPKANPTWGPWGMRHTGGLGSRAP